MMEVLAGSILRGFNIITTYRSGETLFFITDYQEPEEQNEFEYYAGNSNKDVNYPP